MSQKKSDRFEILPKHRGNRNRYEQIVNWIRMQWEVFERSRLGQAGIVILAMFVFLGLFAPVLAPYEPQEKNRDASGSIKRMEAPSEEHLLGTTTLGRDVLSQVIVSTRISLLVGFTAAFVSVFVGTVVGIVSAFYGGWIDDVLMRITDIMYGIPFLPFIIVLVIILGPGLFNIVFAISLVMWRSTARVIRSQVLSIKERPYIEAASAIGASDLRIMGRHLLPNVLPLTFLYGAFNVSFGIIAEASVAFLGYGDPTQISWGKMIFRAYSSSAMREAWWWVFPPAIALSLLVVGVFLISRAYETVTNPELEEVGQ